MSGIILKTVRCSFIKLHAFNKQLFRNIFSGKHGYYQHRGRMAKIAQ